MLASARRGNRSLDFITEVYFFNEQEWMLVYSLIVMGIQREVNNKSYLETPFSIIGDREIDIIKRIVIKL